MRRGAEGAAKHAAKMGWADARNARQRGEAEILAQVFHNVIADPVEDRPIELADGDDCARLQVKITADKMDAELVRKRFHKQPRSRLVVLRFVDQAIGELEDEIVLDVEEIVKLSADHLSIENALNHL